MSQGSEMTAAPGGDKGLAKRESIPVEKHPEQMVLTKPDDVCYWASFYSVHQEFRGQRSLLRKSLPLV